MEQAMTAGRYRPQPVYTKGEEIFSAVSHIVGGAFGLGAWIALAILAKDPVRIAAVSAFGLGIVVLYTMSALYHFLPKGTTAKRVFRIFDHCTIYLLIAGSYTPFCLIALGGTVMGRTVFALQWTLAVGGVTMNAIALDNKIVKGISMALYVVMGWMAVVFLPPLWTIVSRACFWLLIAGGLAYTAGIAFFAFGKKVRYFHSVWHLFVLFGTVLQFMSILLMVLGI